MTDTYTCAACHQTFDEGWTDEEAKAESLRLFGQQTASLIRVCDDCHQAVMGYWENSDRFQTAKFLENTALATENQPLLTLALEVRAGKYALVIVPELAKEAVKKGIVEKFFKGFMDHLAAKEEDWASLPNPPCLFDRVGKLFKKRLLKKKMKACAHGEEHGHA